MDKKEFTSGRKLLGKTQKEMAEILGVSIKAVHSYEQGWRSVPAHVERQMYFLLTRRRSSDMQHKPCWTIKKCPPRRKKLCPAWEFQAGQLCWFINGNLCECKPQKNWKEKMIVCRKCSVLAPILQEISLETASKLHGVQGRLLF